MAQFQADLMSQKDTLTHNKTEFAAEISSLKFELSHSLLEGKSHREVAEVAAHEVVTLRATVQRLHSDKQSAISAMETAAKIALRELQSVGVSDRETISCLEQELRMATESVRRLKVEAMTTAEDLLEQRRTSAALEADVKALKAELVQRTMDKAELHRQKSDAEADISRRQSVVWHNDKNTKECAQCATEFGFFNRKHHCRHCGRVFCSKCAGIFVRRKDWATKQRVCGDCKFEIESSNQQAE